MNSFLNEEVQVNAVPHPGENVTEYLEAYGWSQSDLARRTGLTPKTVSEICNGKAPISPATALTFERVLQRPAHFWLGLQRNYDEFEARAKDSARTSSWHDWVLHFPLKEMRKLNYTLSSGKSDAETLLNFFGVSSPDTWDKVWKASAVAYRQTQSFSAREEAIAAWVREVELVARGLSLADFDEDRLLGSLGYLRTLTRMTAENIMDPVQQVCAAAGVAVVWVPALKGTGISGCARWTSPKRALIGLTLRYKTDDQLWFTLFHELGHVLLHRQKRSFVIDNSEDLSDRFIDPEMRAFEAEADQFSSDVLVPPAELGAFIRRNSFTSEAIHDFAENIGIGPGIVVGRLQHDGILQRHQGNALKQKLDWKFTEDI
jgi:HTH-type transcriptional regulator / antitoxin HigA